MASNKEFNQSDNGLKYSIIFLAIVVIATLGLKFYNSSLVSKHGELQGNLASLETSIEEINLDDKIKIYRLLTNSKAKLMNLDKISNIPVISGELSSLAKKYNISFAGFDYRKGRLSTKATVKTVSEDKYSHKKLVKFIEDFRNDKMKNKFNLDFIGNASGEKTIYFAPVFTIK